MTSAAQLDDLWLRLASAGGQRQYRSLRAPDAGALDVHAAIRALDEARCLLFDLPVPGESDTGFEAGGLRLTRVALDDGMAFALLLEDKARSDLFTTICADVITFADAEDPARALRLVMERLEAWRQFLRSISGGMSRQEAVGLTGELLVLEALLTRDSALLPAWRAPDDGLHDFEHAGHAIEVKTTLGPGWRVTISTIEQLDTVGLDRLDLLQVRLFETPSGDTLGDLIDRIVTLLPDEGDRRAFSNAILQRGLAPDDRTARSGLRTALQHMTSYAVDDQFPRMRRADIAGAIVDLRYVLDLAQLQACAGPATATLDSFGGRGE
jgi:hypothetical protein